MRGLTVSAPGRICLFGEHQDYLGLPVIAAAINLRIRIRATPTDGNVLVVRMPDIERTITLNPAEEQCYRGRRDYLRSAINVLRREGVTWPRGYDVTMRGEIPINAGASSSSAMTVMWLRFLLAIGEGSPECAAEDLARLGHRAEVLEFGEPGGMMDHFCAAAGGALWIDTNPPFAMERLGLALAGFVLGNTGEPKATTEVLGRNRRDVTDGIDLIRVRLPRFDLARTPLAEAETYLAGLPETPRRRLRANLANRDLTLAGRDALLRDDHASVGALLSEHHSQLRDGLDLSTEKMERMIDASLTAGALGAKVNGSGGGGCMFAYAPGKEEAVADAIRREGGQPYIVQVDDGARVE
jgi:galactokinase